MIIIFIENDVLKRVQYFLKFNHRSLYKPDKQSGIAYSSLNNLFNRDTCPTIATLEKIYIGFNISLSEFFDFMNNPFRNDGISAEQQDIINFYESLSKKRQRITASIFKWSL